MERWSGQTAVVTGAGAGIGAAVAAALASAGMVVVAVDRAEERNIADNLKTMLTEEVFKRVVPKKVDVTDHARLEELFNWASERGGVSVLVSCAGIISPGQVTDVGSKVVSAEDLGRILDVNTKGVILCAKFAVASMKKHGIAGHIVNINSLAGHYIPFSSHLNVYTASKHAVTAFTQLLNQELADFKSKIKVTSISPGNTNTALASKSLEHATAKPAVALEPREEGAVVEPVVALDPSGVTGTKLEPSVARMANGAASAVVEPPVALEPSDVAGAVLYALSTSPKVNINELTITSVGEKRL